MTRTPPTTTLFPYTTLFRSAPVGRRPRKAYLFPQRPPLPAHGRGRRSPSPDSCLRKTRSEEHTSELQSLAYLVCRLLLEKKNVRSILDGHIVLSRELAAENH